MKTAERQPPASKKTKRKPDGVDAPYLKDVETEEVPWLWPQWLALGSLHILAGDPDSGKSTIALGFAATVSNGGKWPDGSRCESGKVIVWSSEDSIKFTQSARLRAAEAHEGRVRLLYKIWKNGKSRSFNPGTDLPELEKLIRDTGNVKLVIIDPVISAVSRDSNDAVNVRQSLDPLVDLAERTGCCILGIGHYRKGSAGKNHNERVLGSGAFVQLSRAVFNVYTNKYGMKVFVRSKANLSSEVLGGFGYQIIKQSAIGEIFAGYIKWLDQYDKDADELVELLHRPEPTKREDAKGWLREFLADGPKYADDVRGQAEKRAITDITLNRAKKELGVLAYKERGKGQHGKSMWSLTPPPDGKDG